MNKLSVLALSAAFALSAPIAASAQDLDLGTDIGAEVETGVDLEGDVTLDEDLEVEAGAGVGAAAGAEVASDELDEASFAGAIAGIEGQAMVDLSTVDANTEIYIVTLSSLGDHENLDAFIQARTDLETDVAGAAEKAEANAAVVAALEAEGYAASDVVAIETGANGAVRVYVDDL